MPQEMRDIVTDCLDSVAKKVDAAYAIILGCIKCLGAFATEDILDYLNPFLHSANHNLKYLGLLGLSFIDCNFWKEEWGGTQLGKIICDFAGDDTIVEKALDLLDSVISPDLLQSIIPDILKGIAKDEKETNIILSSWAIRCVSTYYVDKDNEYIVTLLSIMADSKRNVDRALVQEQCQYLEQLLDEQGVALQETVLDFIYKLLEKTSTDIYDHGLVLFLFTVVGKYSYVSEREDVEWMKLIQRWILFLKGSIYSFWEAKSYKKKTRISYSQFCKAELYSHYKIDEEALVAGLAALKRIILRSKIWVSGLPELLRLSPESTEKQELLEITKDSNFKREGRTPATSPKLPNSSRGSEKAIGESPDHKSDSENYLHGSFKEDKPKKKKLCQVNRRERLDIGDQSLVSSLISMDLQDASLMTTERFGELWLSFDIERKKVFKPKATRCDRLARELSQSWKIQIVQVIGQEFIAFDTQDLLIHVAMKPEDQQFELTIRTRDDVKRITKFLSNKEYIKQ